MLKEMLEDPVSKYTNHELTVVDKSVSISDAAKVMTKSKIDSILISEESNIVGILTNKDILSEVVAKGKDPNNTKVGEIAHKPIIKIHKDSSVKDAIALMIKHDIRRLVVKSDERTIGIISRKQIVGNIPQYATELPELETPGVFTCPYCPSQFQDKHALSRHIDNIHIGRGLLEGDLSKTTV